MTYSANDNQNYFVINGRSTSRVLAQPGGQCSISLGGWTPEELERQRQQREAAEQLQAEVTPPLEGNASPATTEKVSSIDVAATGDENPVLGQVNQQEGVSSQPTSTDKNEVAATTMGDPFAKPTAVSSNAFASACTTNSFNVITDRPTSRVTMPPGGHTSIRLW